MPKPSSIQHLRSQMARIAGPGRHAGGQRAALPFGIAEIDSRLPAGGLARGGIHDLVGSLPAIAGFLAALLGRQTGLQQILWVTPQTDLYAPGLSQFGLNHRRLTLACARRVDDRLWAVEEGLRALEDGAVVAEVDKADLTETKRLQLAAESSGGIGFLIRHRPEASAALTRWRIEPMRSADCRATWRVVLERCRGAEAGGDWNVEWDHASLSFRLAAILAGRPAENAAA